MNNGSSMNIIGMKLLDCPYLSVLACSGAGDGDVILIHVQFLIV